MTLVSLSPGWFQGYDILLEAGFAITALIISLFAFKLYRATDQRQIRLFGIAFALISTSYILQSVLNLLIATRVDQTICDALKLQYLSIFSTYGLYAHMLFMITGLTVLAYMTFKLEKMRVLWLMLLLSFIAISFSTRPLHVFFLISSVLLAVTLWHFISNYRQTRQTMTLLVVLAFSFLLFGSLHFILSVDHEIYYVIGHVLELIAYVFILANLYMVLKNGQKT